MNILPDLRNVFNQIPKAPTTEGGLLEWARRLVQVLSSRDEVPLYNVYTPDYASTLEFSPSVSNILRITTVHATGNCTINARTGKIGPVWLIITNDGTSGKTITFGTGFVDSGNLTGTANKTAVVGFISDGVSLYETSRITGL